MSPLRPVKPTYTPKYPRRLTEAELRDYLRPGLARRFSNETMVLSTLLVGSTLASCARVSPPDQHDEGASRTALTPSGTNPLPMMGKSTRNDPALNAKVDAIVNEVLGKQHAGGWYNGSQVGLYRLVSDNPMIKTPEVRISFGNSIMGIFNIEEARVAAKRLFEAYGIPLESSVMLAGDGYRFEADGYNQELGIGFEIRGDMDQQQIFGWDASTAEEAEGTAFLGQEELPALERDVNHDKVDLFVCDPYLNYDGDHRMAMSYYLASVIDYLNWIHGDRTIDYQRVLGDSRELAEPYAYPMTYRALWEPGENATPWIVGPGESRTTPLTESGSAMLKLEPQDAAVLTLATPVPCDEHGQPPWDVLRLNAELLEPAGQPVDIDFRVLGGTPSRERRTFLPGRTVPFEFVSTYAEKKGEYVVEALTITNVNRFPISIHVNSVEVGNYRLSLREYTSEEEQ